MNPSAMLSAVVPVHVLVAVVCDTALQECPVQESPPSLNMDLYSLDVLVQPPITSRVYAGPL